MEIALIRPGLLLLLQHLRVQKDTLRHLTSQTSAGILALILEDMRLVLISNVRALLMSALLCVAICVTQDDSF